MINNKCAYEYRKNLGKELAKETDVESDIIIPAPDSGVSAVMS